jgi:hypothetical protein
MSIPSRNAVKLIESNIFFFGEQVFTHYNIAYTKVNDDIFSIKIKNRPKGRFFI